MKNWVVLACCGLEAVSEDGKFGLYAWEDLWWCEIGGRVGGWVGGGEDPYNSPLSCLILLSNFQPKLLDLVDWEEPASLEAAKFDYLKRCGKTDIILGHIHHMVNFGQLSQYNQFLFYMIIPLPHIKQVAISPAVARRSLGYMEPPGGQKWETNIVRKIIFTNAGTYFSIKHYYTHRYLDVSNNL